LQKNGGNNPHAMIICDGEAVQIEPYMKVDALKEMLREYKIAVAKLPASDTAVAQPCDAWKLFCTIKAYFDSCTDDDIKHDGALREEITSADVSY
jgi:hypothetical protein